MNLAHNTQLAVPQRRPLAVRQNTIPVRNGRAIDRVDPVGAVWGHLGQTQKIMLAIHGVILLAVSYHGYKRNSNSVPWGLAWALGGLACPTVTAGFALTQGFADPKGSSS